MKAQKKGNRNQKQAANHHFIRDSASELTSYYSQSLTNSIKLIEKH